jgi:DtxR family Mn-dependent transcriptional regulator
MENNNIVSESEQMYLVTIARLSEMVDECPIPISKVAEVLDITAISANQMIHHLEQMGLVTYTPYKGVAFTESGWQNATKLLRFRRLWEVFLAEHLHYEPKEAETLACRLEHAISTETADRLAEYLEWPQVSPQGKPIPQSDIDDRSAQAGLPLSSLSAGMSGSVRAILTGETELTFLQQAGLAVGGRFEIVGNQQNGAYLVKNQEGRLINLSAELTQKIQVVPQ